MTATVPSAGGAGALSAAEIDAKHYASISNLSDGGPSKRVCVKAWANESFKACNLIHSLLPQEAKEKHPPPKMEAFHGAQWIDRVVETMKLALNQECCGGSKVMYWGAAKPIMEFLELASGQHSARVVFEDLLPDKGKREAGALTDSIVTFGLRKVSMNSFWEGMPEYWSGTFNESRKFSIHPAAKHDKLRDELVKFTCGLAGGTPRATEG